ncbi:EstA family serine hydrolase [Jiangella gansuensis]|uniref:EstA family serine hydrolase n=1 Tax=Jiangella gansuensis TaxID=281473 RepID=UPI00047C5836|nr:EstA family serine hydrolase [Jiangella gansuensis]
MTDGEVQARVQAAIDRRVRDGSEVGLQVAVLRHGRVVVDAVAGHRDAERRHPVEPGTLFHAASAAKGIAATVAHVLVERGVAGYDLRVADVWPEFARHGKDQVTLRHILLHTAGVPAPPYDTTIEDLCDWDHMCRVLADTEPWWPAGTRFGYHAQTFGFLLGETVRRATGRTLSWWLRDTVTGPLGVVDEVHFGVPETLLSRVAYQHAANGAPVPQPPAGSPADRANPPGIRPDASRANRRDLLTAPIISSGTMSARGAARVYAALLGHVDDVRLVSERRLRELATVVYEGPDEVMDVPSAWAFGYSPARPGAVPSRPGSTFGMAGSNGSAAYADIETGVAVAVMRNQVSPDWSAAAEIDGIIADTISGDPPEESS